jgi:hypothetical protein
MSPSEALRHLLEQRDLAVAAAVTAVAMPSLRFAGERRPVLVLGAVMALVAGQHPLEAIGMIGVAVLLDAMPWPTAAARPTEVLWTAIAAAAIYLCTPDTERSIVLLGVLAVLGPAAVGLQVPWRAVGVAATGLMAWIALADGRGRASAVVAALAIAGVHALGLWCLRRVPSAAGRLAATVVGTLAVVALSRGAGLQADTDAALWRTLAVLVPLAVTAALVRQLSAGRTDVAPPR